MSVNNGCDTCYDYKLIDIADIYLKRKCNGDIIRKIRMGIYDVYVFCDECNDSHDMSFCISLDDGPAEKESIENLYAGKELPSYFATLLNNPSCHLWDS